MVNTFLVDTNFATSASLLDKRRLGKQRVEAQQILQILLNLNEIALQLNIKPVEILYYHENKNNVNYIANTYIKQCKWVDDVVIAYKKYGNILYHPSTFKPITLGFSKHPAVKMWIGCIDALKFYINEHIKEWISRKNKDGTFCKNTMTIHEINTENMIFPWWILNKDSYELISMSNIISLIRKERVRNEPIHYYEIYMNNKGKRFIDKQKYSEWENIGYIWPSNLTFEDIVSILLGFSPFPEEIAEIIK